MGKKKSTLIVALHHLSECSAFSTWPRWPWFQSVLTVTTSDLSREQELMVLLPYSLSLHSEGPLSVWHHSLEMPSVLQTSLWTSRDQVIPKAPPMARSPLPTPNASSFSSLPSSFLYLPSSPRLSLSLYLSPSVPSLLLPATSKPLGGFDSSPELFLPQLYQACRAAHGTIKHLIRSLRNDTSFSLICSKSLRSPEFLHTYYFTCASSYPTSSGWPVSESLNDRWAKQSPEGPNDLLTCPSSVKRMQRSSRSGPCRHRPRTARLI